MPLALHGRELGTSTLNEVSGLESLFFSRCSWALGQEGSHSLNSLWHWWYTGTCHCLVGVHLSPFRNDLSSRSRDHTLVTVCLAPTVLTCGPGMHYLRGSSSFKDSVQWAWYQGSVCSLGSLAWSVFLVSPGFTSPLMSCSVFSVGSLI